MNVDRPAATDCQETTASLPAVFEGHWKRHHPVSMGRGTNIRLKVEELEKPHSCDPDSDMLRR